MANQFLALSLFIMLLSFFIILNTLSTYDDRRAEPILNSLLDTFSVEDKKLVKQGDTPSQETAESEGTSLDQLQDLFTSTISGVKAKQNKLGTELLIRVPYELFIDEVTATLMADAPVTPRAQDGKGFLVPTLVSLMNTENAITYKMDMLVNVETPQEESEEHMRLARDLGRISYIMEQAGLPRKLMTSGMNEGELGYIDIYFRPYHAFDSEEFEKALEQKAQIQSSFISTQGAR